MSIPAASKQHKGGAEQWIPGGVVGPGQGCGQGGLHGAGSYVVRPSWHFPLQKLHTWGIVHCHGQCCGGRLAMYELWLLYNHFQSLEGLMDPGQREQLSLSTWECPRTRGWTYVLRGFPLTESKRGSMGGHT